MKEIFSKSKNFKQEYCCTIVRLGEVKDIPNYDSIGVTIVDNYTMVVRKNECHEGDILFYAANESELNNEFLAVNNLFEMGEYERNSNANEVAKLLSESRNDEAKRLVGFFNKYGRIKMIRLGGTPSFGFLFSQEAMAKWDKNIANIDMQEYIDVEFDMVNGMEFCKPYVPRIKEPKTRERHGAHYKRHMRILKKIERIIPGEFAFHYDTQSVERNASKLNPTDVVDISVKCDGTSFIMGNIKVREPKIWMTRIPFIDELMVRLFLKLPARWQKWNEHYEEVYSSRSKIRSDNEFYTSKNNPFVQVDEATCLTGLDQVFKQYGHLLKGMIPDGITIYGEIIGYVPNTHTGIQTRGGKVYDYGCQPGENKLMIYRVTQMTQEGTILEYEVNEVLDFTHQLIAKNPQIANNIFLLPILYHGQLSMIYPELSTENHWHENFVAKLKQDKDLFKMECKEPLCNNSFWREGIIIRVANDPIKEAYKLKCANYLKTESDDISKGVVSEDLLEGYSQE